MTWAYTVKNKPKVKQDPPHPYSLNTTFSLAWPPIIVDETGNAGAGLLVPFSLAQVVGHLGAWVEEALVKHLPIC